MSGLRGVCPQCGASYYYGQAVNCPGDRTCSDCGHELEIFKDGVRIETNHSLHAIVAVPHQTGTKSGNGKYIRGKIK